MEPPASTVLILLLTLGLTLASNTIIRLSIDVKHRNELQQEQNEYKRELREAKKSGDKRLYEKLKRREDRVQKLSMQVARQSMKANFILFVPFLLFFYLFNGVFSNPATGMPRIVAFAPLPLPFLGAQLTFWSWYILCSFGMNTLIGRIMGIYAESGVPPPKSRPAKPGESEKSK